MPRRKLWLFFAQSSAYHRILLMKRDDTQRAALARLESYYRLSKLDVSSWWKHIERQEHQASDPHIATNLGLDVLTEAHHHRSMRKVLLTLPNWVNVFFELYFERSPRRMLSEMRGFRDRFKDLAPIIFLTPTFLKFQPKLTTPQALKELQWADQAKTIAKILIEAKELREDATQIFFHAYKQHYPQSLDDSIYANIYSPIIKD